MAATASPRILTLEQALDALRSGQLVLYPTETLYGLGCDAMNPDAAARVFLVKRRSFTLPLPVIISSLAMLDLVAYSNPHALGLMRAFWPGPLTIVLPARKEVPDILTGRLRRVAVRFSPHQAALDLSRALGSPLVASSANISGIPAVGRMEDLDPEIVDGAAGLYPAGAEPDGRLPSTVVDIFEGRAGGRIRILRRGAVTAHQLRTRGFAVTEP